MVPLIARAITVKEPSHNPHPARTYGIALVAEGGINSQASLDALMHFAPLVDGGAIRASYAPESSKKAPTSPVKEEIDRVFGKNHIMYWVAVNESELSPTAASGSGAEGVFQITQGTWRNFKCSGTHFDYKANTRCAKKIYDANGLKDWRWSKHEGSQGGWAKHLSTSHGG